MAISWIFNTQNTIYTIVKTRAKQVLGDKYPQIDFTTNAQQTEYTKFPTVYIHFMPTAELGSDLEGRSVNGVVCGVQIAVTTSKSQGQLGCNEVMYTVLEEFKRLYFYVNMMPEFLNTGNSDTIQSIARCRRAIGYNDVIN